MSSGRHFILRRSLSDYPPDWATVWPFSKSSLLHNILSSAKLTLPRSIPPRMSAAGTVSLIERRVQAAIFSCDSCLRCSDCRIRGRRRAQVRGASRLGLALGTRTTESTLGISGIGINVPRHNSGIGAAPRRGKSGRANDTVHFGSRPTKPRSNPCFDMITKWILSRSQPNSVRSATNSIWP
jgi:hypothetical protein